MKKENIFKRVIKRFWKLSWWKKTLIILLVLAAGWGVKAAFFSKPPVPQFKLGRVKKGDIMDIVEASGPINPVNTTEIGALVSGEILKIYVDYNTEVKKGDLMAVIDQTQILASLEEAKALTGMSNPNSPAQIKEYLHRATGLSIDSLNKKNLDDIYCRTPFSSLSSRRHIHFLGQSH